MNGSSVSEWDIVKFKTISCPTFPVLSHQVVYQLSTNQHYGYCMCHAIITGDMGEDLSLLEVQLLNNKWLTLAHHIMQYHVSQRNHCKNFKKLVKFIVKIHLPSWFEIKANNRLNDGSQNLFNMIQRTNSFPDIKICKLY